MRSSIGVFFLQKKIGVNFSGMADQRLLYSGAILFNGDDH
jgi:hypothetical protein